MTIRHTRIALTLVCLAVVALSVAEVVIFRLARYPAWPCAIFAIMGGVALALGWKYWTTRNED